MNTNVKALLSGPIDQNTFRILYYRNKIYLIPLFLFVLSMALLFFAIVPQVQDYFTLKDQEKNIQERIVKLKSNASLLSKINETDLDMHLQTATAALPAEKDFGGILRVIGQAAQDANVILGDFSFEVGQLSPKSTKVTNALPIEITLTVNGGIDGNKRFLSELTRRLPLSEVLSIRTGRTSSNIVVVFYYKPISPITFNGSGNIPLLSKDDLALLNKLSSFRSESTQSQDQTLPLLSQ